MIYASMIPSHKIASWLMQFIDSLIAHIGLKNQTAAQEIIYFIVILAIAFFVAWIIKRLVLSGLRKAIKLRDTAIARELLRERTLSKCCEILPPLIIMAMLPFAFNSESLVLDLLMKCMGVYAMVAFAIGSSAVMTFIFNRYNERENTRNLPIRGFLNVGKGIIWIIISILSVSILIDKSPTTLLAGLGAFAAALLLIFKDSILGFVAGIQMSQNDMLRVGDWIVVPSTIADGIVLDVSLSVVKIQNWDNTIVMVPPYTLVSTSFQNWRGMSESGMRRIARSYLIDITTVKPVDDAFVDSMVQKFPELKAFVSRLHDSGKNMNAGTDIRAVNGSLETNLGLFRAYITQYIVNHPDFSATGQILVRLLAPEQAGVPLQIWCWTATTNWTAYEGIQSALFEHIAATLPVFGLAVYAEGSENVQITNNKNNTPAPTSAPAPTSTPTQTPKP